MKTAGTPNPPPSNSAALRAIARAGIFHRCCSLPGALAFASLFTLTAQITCAQMLQLESADLALVIEKTGGTGDEGVRLVSLTDKATGRVFCSAPARPLFSLTLCSPKDTKKQRTARADAGWNSAGMEKKGNVLHLAWRGFNKLAGADNARVDIKIAADPARPGIEISQTAAAGSEQVSIVSMRLGQIAVRDFGADTKVFMPFRSGKIFTGSFEATQVYPSAYSPMPWCVVWGEKTPEQGFRDRDGIGLYVGYHDPQGARKDIQCNASGKKEGYAWPDTVSFWATVHAENMFEPNNNINIGGKAVWRTIRNNWYDGAMIYRDWARKEAPWFPRDKMDENGRTDTPQWFKEHCLWAMHRVTPQEMIAPMKKFRDAFGVPVAVHWYYWWNMTSYDNDYPHFFPKDGFKEAVDELQKDGDIFIMPYINGLLWDTRDGGLEDWLYTKEGFPGAVKNKDGSASVHSYGSLETDGSKVVVAYMCPTTQVWHHKVRENVLRLMNVYGTKAVYVDQVGHSVPKLCFDRSHGHPLGGGHWWHDGYRAMLEIIRADLSKSDLQDFPLNDTVKARLRSNPGALRERALTTESTTETMLSSFDGCLTWTHQQQGQVPAFAAVYGGAIQMLGRDYRAGKDYAVRTLPGMTKTAEPLACRMKTAQALCYGEQIGWYVPTIVDEADKFPFQRAAVRVRHQARHYFYKGEMCRPPELPDETPVVTADWNFYNEPPVTFAAVQTGCWRIVKNGKTQSAILLFANTSAEPVTTRFRIDLAELGLDETRITIRQIGPEGVEKTIEPDALDKPVVFPGEAVFAWEITAR